MISSRFLCTPAVAEIALFGIHCSSSTPGGGNGGSGPATGGASGGTATTSTGGVAGSGGGTSGGAGGNGSGGKAGNGAGGSADGGNSGAGSGGSGNGGAGSGGAGSGGSGGSMTGDGGSGGAPDAALAGIGGAPPYQGPCDVLAGGCAEAYGVARAMVASYAGPLFQLGLAKDKTKTLDVGQTSDRKADMTTWSAFCGGTQSNCVIAKIYAQIHTGNNDLVPSVFGTPGAPYWGPDCSAGGYTCAAKFTIETATGLPILTTVAPQEYAIRTDTKENLATGINGGSKAMGIMYNGKPVPNQTYCCGTFGLTHKYDEEDIPGTDFMTALGYGWNDPGGNGVSVNCGKSNTYCVGAEEESNNDLVDYGTSPIENAMVVTQFDPSPNAVTTWLNVSTAIHLGGGSDLSQPAPVLMREALITNSAMISSEVMAMKANTVAFYPSLRFP